MDYAIRPIWNVMATIQGTVEPDRWVMIGNHRDAWTYGAVDPNSGSTAWLETARALSEALKAGWKPRRSILFASWDAEEYGLVGSIEYGEQYADAIRENAVIVLNVDSAVSGPNLDINGVPSLRDLVLGAAADVNDPRSGKPLAEVWLNRQRRQWAEAEPVPLDKPDVPFVPQLGAVGSGSDYTVFLDHLGVPILDVDFGGRYGVYHSMYDNLFWMENLCDPEYAYHTTAAKLYTLILMRAATAEVVPMRFVPYGEAIADYRDDLKRQLVKKQRLAEIDGSTAWMPDFKVVDDAVDSFASAAKDLDDALTQLQQRDGLSDEQWAPLNDAVARIERSFTDPEGLPEREWFRHLVYAPGLTTGYASWPLPGLRQAVEQDQPELFAQQAPRLAARLHAAAEALRAAAEIAQSLAP
jgi:N-acetylated-alpha-linked acidic dipeptidase